MKKFSFIVPVYGVEAYLEKCVDSMLAQTYEELEVVVVDDCSKDNTVSVVESIGEIPEKLALLSEADYAGMAASARTWGEKLRKGEMTLAALDKLT